AKRIFGTVYRVAAARGRLLRCRSSTIATASVCVAPPCRRPRDARNAARWGFSAPCSALIPPRRHGKSTSGDTSERDSPDGELAGEARRDVGKRHERDAVRLPG